VSEEGENGSETDSESVAAFEYDGGRVEPGETNEFRYPVSETYVADPVRWPGWRTVIDGCEEKTWLRADTGGIVEDRQDDDRPRTARGFLPAPGRYRARELRLGRSNSMWRQLANVFR